MTHAQPSGSRSRTCDYFYMSYAQVAGGLYSVSVCGSGVGPSHASGTGSVSGTVAVVAGGGTIGAAGENRSRFGSGEWGFGNSYTETD